MDFALNDEQHALQETARRFAQNEIAPAAAHFDQVGEFPREIIKKAWELGLASMCVPEAYGGVGLSVLDSCIAVEELAWGCAGMATSIMCNDLGLMPIIVGGSDEQGSAGSRRAPANSSWSRSASRSPRRGRTSPECSYSPSATAITTS